MLTVVQEKLDEEGYEEGKVMHILAKLDKYWQRSYFGEEKHGGKRKIEEPTNPQPLKKQRNDESSSTTIQLAHLDCEELQLYDMIPVSSSNANLLLGCNIPPQTKDKHVFQQTIANSVLVFQNEFSRQQVYLSDVQLNLAL